MRQVAPPLSFWQNKRLPCCWGVSDQHNVYFTIQSKVIQLTNYLRSARALQKEATRRWESECNTTAVTATATATAVRILHTYKASAAAAAAVQPAATTATVAVAVAAVQSGSICVDHL